MRRSPDGLKGGISKRLVVLSLTLLHFLLLSAVGGHVGTLSVDPTTRHECGPVLKSEMVVLVVENVLVHQFTELVKIVKGDHGVTMVLGVEVGIPQ